MDESAEAGWATASDGEPGSGKGDPRARSDTRARIQQVAVELFTEHGYEGTSLREIAERLDVTKAALYYHFRSKEDIVASLVEDYYAQIDALIAWAREQPRTPETRGEIIRRYVRIVAGGDKVFRMLQQNQASVSTLGAAKHRGELFKERMHSLVEVLAGPDSPIEEKIRAAMALGGISVGLMFFTGRTPDRFDLTDTVSCLAGDLLGCESPRTASASTAPASTAPASTAPTTADAPTAGERQAG